MLRTIIMLILLVIGLGLVCYAKMHFAQRQKTEPDNKWSAEENKLRYAGYIICIIDVIIAGFINF